MTTDFSDTDIAIVGMAIRVPGASTPEAYWANLRDGVESIRFYSDDELRARGVPESTLADPNYVKAGMPLQGYDEFDPDFFGFSPKEAAILDPQHRQFYEVAWEALERAGHAPANFDGAVGVFAGCGMGAYFMFNLLSNPALVDEVGMFLLRHTGNDKDFLATRVSYTFNLKGPSVNVQTACSTSLVAVHMAAQSLLSGECDMALAGGSTIELPHNLGYEYKEGEILSPDGHCRAFDHRSKGTVFGSGTGVVVLRRLADAIADGDHIHAVIKGTAVNNDGSGKVGYLAPSVEGQAAAMAEALAVADVDADSISYVECHGTGTPVGDPIEIAALTKAFRESSDRVGYCRIGSVKSSIGHLDTAAGVASLIKATLALEHGQIPPSLNYEAPNPAIEFTDSPFVVADRLQPWPGTGPRRAAVNSLGVGGTNAFAILEQAPVLPPSTTDTQPQLLVISANNRKALDDAAARLAAWLGNNTQVPLADVAYSLLLGRHGFEQRRILAANDHLEAARLLRENDARRVFNQVADLDRPSLVMMYPGGGAQYFRMSRDLYDQEPVFKQHMDQGLALLRTRFGVDLSAIYLADSEQKEHTVQALTKPGVQLPLIFLVEYALTKLWAHYGVVPAAVMGHSLGENTAACIAGVFSFEDALGLVLLRGQLMDEVPAGGMLSVSMPADELRTWLGDELDLAAANSPQLSVASGPADKLDVLAAKLTAAGIDNQRVRINIAAHSRLLDGILEPFGAYLRSIRLQAPQLPIMSNRTGDWLTPAQATDPDYWVAHLRNSILFAQGVDTLLAEPERVFLEVGPGNTLGSLVRQNPQAPAQRVLSSLRHPEDPVADTTYLRAIMGRLWALGIKLDTGKLWQGQRRRVPLPTYPFQHARYWIEPGKGQQLDSKVESRPMRLPEFDSWFRAPRWVQQGILESLDTPCRWLVFHGREPVADALLAQLRADGHQLICVQPGDTFARINTDTFTLAPEAGGSGYQELIDTLVAEDLLPERILHTWLLTWDRSFRPGSTFFHRNQEHGFYSLFYLARALSKANATEQPLHMIVAANGAHRLGTESVLHPDKATALGPCAVIPREYPKISCSFVDLVLDEKPERGRSRQQAQQQLVAAAAAALAAEASAKAENQVIAWRDQVRWQRTLSSAAKAMRSLKDAPPKVIRGGVYLLTGGFGGISGVIADWLARSYQAKLVLLSRTPLPVREEWPSWLQEHAATDSISQAISRIQQLEAMGAQVLPIAADVTVAEQMQEALAQTNAKFGALRGVFHTAGVIRDSLIALKSQRDIEEVFAAKVYGTLVLDELLQNTPLDFLLLFSSTSAYVAPQGQIDYVGANAFVNAFAQAQSGHRPWPVTAINWGIWRDVGMVGSQAGANAASNGSVQMPVGNGTETAAPGHKTNHPLFQQHQVSRDGVLQEHVFSGSLSTQDWVINEHRLANGDALLPGTGYLELIRAALAEIGVAGPWQIANLLFQNPLYVTDTETRAFQVQLRGDQQRWEAQILAADTQGWSPCASARVTQLTTQEQPAALNIPQLEQQTQAHAESAGGGSTIRTKQEDHLQFGPRWRVLKRIQHDKQQALARLQIPAGYEADLHDYGLHPGLLDIATGCAMDLIPGYAEQEVASHLWVPLSYRQFRYFAPLTAHICSHLKLAKTSDISNGFAAFDVCITDPEGQVLVQIDQLTLRRIDGRLANSKAMGVGSNVQPNGESAAENGAGRRKLSPGEQALQHNVSQGIAPTDGIEALDRLLRSAMPAEIIISSMDPAQLIRQAESISQAASGDTEARFARPELDSDFEPPRDEVEKGLADLWGKLLGVEGIGIRDSFFDLGGHSLIAVRLFNEISDKYGVDLPMSVLMQTPTVAGLAEMIRGEAPTEDAEVQTLGASPSKPAAATLKYKYIVPMHTGPVADGVPLFLVAGMFGNVLNLSHLAHLLGEERPFYAIQARGLYGDAPPHESFEEMARDYLAEIRQVQPKGPYLLGGFSGGGLIAFEIARQLLAQGEQIETVILLDTPVYMPARLSIRDKLSMLWQDFRILGPEVITTRIRDRLAWHRAQQARQAALSNTKTEETVSFQSEKVGEAFMRSLMKYQMHRTDVAVALFRPRLNIKYRLPGDRQLDDERNYLLPDNGWTPYVRQVTVFEVPGNHDSMVLEPNVRVLVSLVRRAITTAEAAG